VVTFTKVREATLTAGRVDVPGEDLTEWLSRQAL